MTANGPGATNYAYTADGNLTYKSDYGVEHQYGGAGCPGRPHFVTQVTKGDTGPNGTDTFTCDANGNVNGGNSLTAAVYDFQNQARRLQRYATGSSDFRYGADGNRYMEVSLSGSSSLTTRFGPRGYEKSSDNTSTTLRHELGPVTVRQTDGGSFVPVAQLRDRLGSTLAQASATGSATNKRGYDSFGEVTNGDFSPRQPAVLGLAPTTLRGFTGHEHLDAVRLIHMNGRIYDPKLGRFYSVDPVIQFPSNSQSLNPYSYILNNPLSGRDPSGYMSQLDMRTNRIIANANNNCMGGVLCIAASEKAFLAGPRSNLAGMTSGGASPGMGPRNGADLLNKIKRALQEPADKIESKPLVEVLPIREGVRRVGDGSRAYREGLPQPDEANAEELGFVRGIASDFEAYGSIENCALICRDMVEVGPTHYVLSDVHTDRSQFGCNPSGLSCPSGLTAVSDIHNHPADNFYRMKSTDVRLLGQGTVGDRKRVNGLSFSMSDMQGLLFDQRNGWVVPIGSNKLLYFPKTMHYPVHNVYDQ